MDYNEFRLFADSVGLVLLMAFFVGVLFFIFRPGSRQRYDDASRIPLKED